MFQKLISIQTIIFFIILYQLIADQIRREING